MQSQAQNLPWRLPGPASADGCRLAQFWRL